jgi:peptidyl-prolyl cis-trans isomerase SurA
MLKKIRFWTALLFLSAVFTGVARPAEVVDRILAVVNDEIVTEQELQIVMAPVIAQYRTMYAGQEYEDKVSQARQEFLDKVIDDKLILGEAKRKQVIVKDPEVDEMLTEVRNKFPSREAFIQAIEDQGLTEKKLWNRFRDQLMTQKLVAYEVKSKVSVSPGEVNEYYKSHTQQFVQNDRVHLQHILIRTSTRSEEEAKVLADTLFSQLQAGKSFEELAQLNSEGAEASEGGEMGWVEKGQLMGEIDEKVFGLEKGQIAGPIRSSLGFHIFKVVERTQSSVKPLSEVRGEVQDALFKAKLRERLESWMKSLKKNAYISIR